MYSEEIAGWEESCWMNLFEKAEENNNDIKKKIK